MHGSDFAKKLGVDKLVTHVGFLPENPSEPIYEDIICAIRKVAWHCKKNDQYFLFETGRETPIALLRTIENITDGNVGINLDSANLILYGKGNPVDAVEIFGKYIMEVHAKDGMYPTNDRELGKKVKIGHGKVNFPALIKRLNEVDYIGTLTIEREIEGKEQAIDIIEAANYLKLLI